MFRSAGSAHGVDSADVNGEYFYAYNAERTYATGQALAAGLLPSVSSTVNELAHGATDPLFYPVKLNLGSPNLSLAQAAPSGRIGNNPPALVDAYKTQLNELESVFQNQSMTDPTYAPSFITSNLLLHIVNTLNQAATGTAMAHALGAPGQKLVVLTGHDNQLAAVGGVMRADWAADLCC